MCDGYHSEVRARLQLAIVSGRGIGWEVGRRARGRFVGGLNADLRTRRLLHVHRKEVIEGG